MTTRVIIEGPDGAGKTMLANRWAAECGARVVHEGPPPKVDLLHYYYGLIREQLTRGGSFIFDRCYLGELVYGPLVRGESRLDPVCARMLHEYCQAQGIVEVVLQPGFDAVLRAWEATREKQLLKNTEDLAAAYTRYAELSKTYNAKIILRSAELPVSRNEECVPYGVPALGDALTATVLIVGEKANGEIDLPFFTSSKAGSSWWLRERVENAGISPAWVNAIDGLGNKVNLEALIHWMPKLRTIISLGNVAERCVEWQLRGTDPVIYSVKVPHPMFWKRFHYGDPAGYEKLLKEATR